jgi:acyl-CoA synthetase (NDP forming)/GNAT superfamily N-acetyltransferase
VDVDESVPTYPTHWEADVLLLDGSAARLRPIRPDDADALVAFHSRLSAQTIYRRFFSPRPVLPPKDVERFTNVDYRRRLALVAVIDDEMAAVARYDAVNDDEAEVAFVIEDRHQGRGLGSLLLEHLAAAARERGFHHFVAETLAENRAMLGVFRDAGFEATRTFEDGTVHLRFPIDETPAAVEAMAERERRSTVESMTSLIRPRSVAVVGASRQRGSLSHTAFRNLLLSEFQGPVYPVNSTAEHVAGVRATADVGAIADPVDLAIVAVPAEHVAEVIDACGEKGIRSVVVISAGFAETGPEGAEAELELVRVARHHGMRLVGPNSMGVINTSPSVSMNATVSGREPIAGRVALGSQSGALGIAVVQQAVELGIGLSSFVSVGNKADVSSNDLLQYWEADGETDVILLYLESFGNPRKFARIARRVGRSKPIVVVKSGRSESGAPDDAIDALFRQTGVLRVDSLAELFDVAVVLANQPVPNGSRLAIVGSAGGPSRLAADACEAAGLTLADLAPATRAAVAPLTVDGDGTTNPIDLRGAATAEEYAAALHAVSEDDGVDAVLAIFTPPLAARPEDVAEAVAAVAGGVGKPVVATSLGGRSSTGLVAGTETALHPVPVFPFPEAAVRALGRTAAYGAWRRRGEGTLPSFDDIDIDAIRHDLDAELSGSEGRAASAEATEALLRRAGIPMAPPETAETGAVEVVVSIVHDRAFGPLLSFGLRGVAVDLLGDRAFRVLPLTDQDATELLHAVRSSPLLFGYGGATPVDEGALVDLLLRVSTVGERVPEIRELVLDPVVASPGGVSVRGATLRIAPAPVGPSPLLRRLR